MDKIVVITGGTSGIGLETVKLFENAGEKVIVLARHVDKDNHMQYSCDISNEKNVSEVFQDIKTRFGRIDVLINNSGYGMSGITELISTSDAKNIFDVNFYGTWFCTKYALPLMQKGAKVINVASAMALFPVPYRSFYAASKSAVLTLTYSWRSELSKIGIDMCAVNPGDIKTKFTQNRVKNFETNDRYGNNMQEITKKLDSKENKRMKPIVVAKCIYNISTRNKSKPMYIVGGKYKLLNFASHLVPTKLLLWGISKFTS